MLQRRRRPRRRQSRAASTSHETSPGSIDPERVAITSPSSGVKPIVVSTERPPRTAASEAPAPRWQVTTRTRRRRAPAQRGRAPRRRTRATGRGTRTAGRRALAPRRAGSRRWTPPRAASRGTRCRSTRRAGRPAATARTGAIAASDRGWWSGARAASARDRRDDAVVDRARPAPRTASRRGPPGGRPRRPGRAVRDRGRERRIAVARRGRSGRLEDGVVRRRAAGACRLLDPALTTRIHAACGSGAPATIQSRDLGRVLALEPGVRPRLRSACRPSAGGRGRPRREPGHPVDHVDHEVEPVEVVEHDHVERRRGRALLLVAADVDVARGSSGGRSGGG